jgi:hypothetical protein
MPRRAFPTATTWPGRLQGFQVLGRIGGFAGISTCESKSAPVVLGSTLLRIAISIAATAKSTNPPGSGTAATGGESAVCGPAMAGAKIDDAPSPTVRLVSSSKAAGEAAPGRSWRQRAGYGLGPASPASVAWAAFMNTDQTVVPAAVPHPVRGGEAGRGESVLAAWLAW